MRARETVGDLKDDRPSATSRTDLERPPSRLEGDAGLLPPGTVLAARYEVRGVIGRGGMGLVVEAFDRTLGVAVAVKIVRGDYAAERSWSERLAREVKLARQIHHPNVCRVFDYAQADGRAFLIMELAGGGTLRDELGAGVTAARPLAGRLDDARAIAAGLAAIHAAGIVHRDISPQNALRMSDGRLVLSDFGLATDSLDGSTSIHGGTVAYMAPEVLRGGRAGFASDIWSLGAVIHETVFGERLEWDPDSKEMRSAVAGRRLTRVEQSVLEICRACTASNPERRARDAGAIAAQLSEAGLARAAKRQGRGRAGLAVAAVLVASAAVGGARHLVTGRKAGTALGAMSVAPAPADPLMIVPTGEPEDWSDKSKVLAEVPDRIRCIVPLPDHHTVRFVWGYPARAEDLDTRTGKRFPSPLVPDAYAEGCPDLSRDGKRLVYAGHTADDRAFAFVSNRTDGSDAVPEVPTVEPTMDSDPSWLPDGDSFVYDVDDKHSAVFSMTTKRSGVLPTANAPLVSSFHSVAGNGVAMGAWLASGVENISAFSFPRLERVISFDLPVAVLDLRVASENAYFCSMVFGSRWVTVKVDPVKQQARFVGRIGDQSCRRPLFVDNAVVLVSSIATSHLTFNSPGGETTRVPVDGDIVSASRCGERLIASHVKDRVQTTIWIDSGGKIAGALREGEGTFSPRCSADGRTVFWSTGGTKNLGVQRCDGARCRTVFDGFAVGLALSPDDRRLAFLASDNRGQVVEWITTDGLGKAHVLAEVDTLCIPVWSDARTIWVALRKGRRIVWTQFNTDSGRPTGQASEGTRDCTDGYPDPASPVKESVAIEPTVRSQLRLLPEKYLPTD